MSVSFHRALILPGHGCCVYHNPVVNMLPDSVENAHVVSAEGLTILNDGYNAHFDLRSQRELCRRYAAKMLDVAKLSTGIRFLPGRNIQVQPKRTAISCPAVFSLDGRRVPEPDLNNSLIYLTISNNNSQKNSLWNLVRQVP